MEELNFHNMSDESVDTRTASEGGIQLTVNVSAYANDEDSQYQQSDTIDLSLRSWRRKNQKTLVFVEASDVEYAAWYGRYSTLLQRSESLPDQKRICQEAARRNQHTIHPDFEYSDEAVSGTKLNREGLNKLMEAASQGKFKVLYLHSLSRIGRESLITIVIIKRLVHKYGVRVIVPGEGIDTARDGWEYQLAMISAMNDRFIKDLSANVLRGQEGLVLGEQLSVGDWCFGYGSIPIDGPDVVSSRRSGKPRKKYVVDQCQATWVVKIFNWFVRERRSLKWIVRELNQANAPKDHRSKRSQWHHALVINVLSNPKYIGIWPWGRKKNERDPETGKIRQVERNEAEIQRYVREFPDLRIIDNHTFRESQKRLEDNAEKYAKKRDSKGRLRGSTPQSNGRTKQRLLSGLMRCAACGSPFHHSGKKLLCRGYARGICTVKTSLRTELAEQLLLGMIGRQILNDKQWLQSLFQEMMASHREFRSRVPDSLAKLEKTRADLDRMINHLLDQIEQGSPPADINSRLIQRRAQQNEIVREIERLKIEASNSPSTPTLDWLRKQLGELDAVLRNSGSAANSALRSLIPEGIVLEECPVPHRNRFYLRGRFELHLKDVAESFGYSATTDQAPIPGVSYFIDFVDTDFASSQRDQLYQLYTQGKLGCEIAEIMNISKSRVTAILNDVFAHRGEPKPDGRARRFTLSKTP